MPYCYLQENFSISVSFAHLIGICYEKGEEEKESCDNNFISNRNTNSFHTVLPFDPIPFLKKESSEAKIIMSLTSQCQEVGDKVFGSVISAVKTIRSSAKYYVTLTEQYGAVADICEAKRRLQYWNTILARLDGNWTTLLCLHDIFDAGVDVCQFPRHIFICHKLPQKLSLTNDELAAVYAHEIGHIALNHTCDWDLSYLVTLSGTLPLCLAMAGGFQIGLVGFVIATAYYCHRKRQEEHNADTVAHFILAASGYSMSAFKSLMTKLQGVGKKNGMRFLSTHPTMKERIERSDLQTKWMLKSIEAAKLRANN